MTQAQDTGNVERAQVLDLATTAVKLLERAAAPAGRAALSLVSGAGAPLKQTLLALRGGVHLAEHNAPGAATLQVLWGPGAAGDERPSWELRPGDHLQILVGELARRRRPVDRGRDTIRSRETPGNLSGSGSETHQHFYPTGASCCQSLLLDPDATIGIDLHKRLFLLVSGRGE
jgi:hypothetical protein